PALSGAALRGIFAATPAGGPITSWDALPGGDAWAGRKIILYGSAPNFPSSELMKYQVLEGGGLSARVQAQVTQSSVVQAVAADPDGIGYASIFFQCKRARVLPIEGPDGGSYRPDPEDCRQGRYPLSRYLYVCVNKP